MVRQTHHERILYFLSHAVGSLRMAQPLLENPNPLSLEGEGQGEGETVLYYCYDPIDISLNMMHTGASDVPI